MPDGQCEKFRRSLRCVVVNKAFATRIFPALPEQFRCAADFLEVVVAGEVNQYGACRQPGAGLRPGAFGTAGTTTEIGAVRCAGGACSDLTFSFFRWNFVPACLRGCCRGGTSYFGCIRSHSFRVCIVSAGAYFLQAPGMCPSRDDSRAFRIRESRLPPPGLQSSVLYLYIPVLDHDGNIDRESRL